MADCHNLFKAFLSIITIPTAQKETLRKGKDAIRKKIEAYFSEELEVEKPHFFLQGSYALKTMVRPLGTDDYDLDDGVYLQHTDDNMSKPTPETVSHWIVKAVEKHVQGKPQNLKNCVRLVYAAGYHIDLPVYREVNDRIYLGSLEGNQWVHSDAKAFHKWFHDRLEATEQVRSCIKYLKAWKDFLGSDLKGVHITALVGLNHVPVEDRDDESVALTVERMRDYLKEKKAIWNPVDPEEDLLKGWSDAKLSQTIKHLDWFSEKATAAQQCPDQEEAAQEWRVLFGDRFPVKCEKKEKTVTPSSPFAVPQRREPSWPMRLTGQVTIDARATQDGWRALSSQEGFSSINKGYLVKFQARTNLPRPYDVHWQVVNTGSEAEAARDLRGTIFQGSETRTERTKYRGFHWVQCFIVKDGYLMAQSREFIVNVP